MKIVIDAAQDVGLRENRYIFQSIIYEIILYCSIYVTIGTDSAQHVFSLMFYTNNVMPAWIGICDCWQWKDKVQ